MSRWFKNSEDVDFLIKLFGRKNIFFANARGILYACHQMFLLFLLNVIVSDHRFLKD